MGSDVIIDIVSLIIGAVLASAGGIIINRYTEERKEKKIFNAFIFEFKLHFIGLSDYIENFPNALKNGQELLVYFSKHLVKNPIFHEYKMISEIPGIDIEKYYELITTLEKIDVEIDRYILSNEDNSASSLIIMQYQKLDEPYLAELKNLFLRLK